MVRVTTLGDCRIDLEGSTLRPVSGLNYSIVLYLLAEADKYILRAKLRELFWPDASDADARHSLRQLVYMIRESGVKVSRDRDHVWVAAHTVTLDYVGLVADSKADPALLLREFLPGYDPQISKEHEKWFQGFRDRAHAHLRNTLIGVIVPYKQSGRWTDVEAAARRCLELDPLNEEATLSLAEALAMMGRKLGAMEVLDKYRHDLGPHAVSLQLPASLLRQRISELLPPAPTSPKGVLFIGRSSQLAVLNSQCKQLRISRGGNYHVWGARGIGKSRLIAEVARLATLDGVKVISLTCVRRKPQSPRSTLQLLIQELLRLPGAIGSSPSTLSCVQSFIDASISISAQDLSDTDTDAFHRVEDALIDLAAAISHEQPLLIVLEDIDRLNRACLEMLNQLRSNIHDRPILIISSSRDASALMPLTGIGVESVRLEGLSQSESSTLLQELTSRSASMTSAFASRCVAVADGNPALLIDLAFQWWAQGTAFQFPPSVTSAIEERLSAVSDTARRLLQLCAVFATECTIDRVIRTGLYDSSQLVIAIDQLGRAGLVRFDKSSLAVADPLVSTQLLGSLSEAATKYFHRLAALSLESELQLPQYDVRVWHCARHHGSAGDSARAVEILTMCADHALKNALLSECIGILQRARELCSTDEERLAVNDRLVKSLQLAERWKLVLRAAEVSSHLRREAQPNPDCHDHVELASLAARWHLGQPTTTLINDASRCMLDDRNSPQHRADATVQILIYSHNMGDVPAMQAAYAIASDLHVRTGGSPSTLTAEMIYHAAAGDLSIAEEMGKRLLIAARDQLFQAELAVPLRQVAQALRLAGRYDEARRLLQEALSITTAVGAQYGSLKSADMIGTTFLEEGDLSQAWAWYLKSMRWADGVGDPNSFTYGRSLGARVALLQNDTSTATRLARLQPTKLIRRCVTRTRCEELAIWVLLALQKGESHFDEIIIAAFEQAFATVKKLGNQDFAAYALTRLRRTTVGAESAASLISEYLGGDRREKGSPPAFLLDLQQSLDSN
jgi:DNA-binding SARP family transcriptional activator/tetratricopeptide (TPR) repeat protein